MLHIAKEQHFPNPPPPACINSTTKEFCDDPKHKNTMNAVEAQGDRMENGVWVEGPPEKTSDYRYYVHTVAEFLESQNVNVGIYDEAYIIIDEDSARVAALSRFLNDIGITTRLDITFLIFSEAQGNIPNYEAWYYAQRLSTYLSEVDINNVWGPQNPNRLLIDQPRNYIDGLIRFFDLLGIKVIKIEGGIEFLSQESANFRRKDRG